MPAQDFFNRVIQPFVRRNNWSKGQQAQHYKRQYKTFDNEGKKYGRQMVPSATEMEDVSSISAAEFQQQAGSLNSFVYRTESNKAAKLSAWREMSLFPEIAFALGEIEDEAINFDVNGNVLQLVIKNDRILQNENACKNILKQFSYITEDVMDSKNNINGWFLQFMVDAEIMFEKVVDPVTAKERGIIRVKQLRPEFTHPIWEEIESDRIHQFVHKGDKNIIVMPPEMVAYANSGIYRYPDMYTKEVLSYLEVAKVDYRKLRQLEDALVIYRLVRAPERRVFKIEVGKLPKQKAEQYVQNLMRKYRQRKTYDPSTGEASQVIDTMAMIEDFWLPSQDGKGSSIETLPGGENLGQIDDVLYFLDKLYRAMRIPMSRVKSDTGFSLGDTSDITREEVRFNKMVSKFVNRFSSVFLQIFMSHIRLIGLADQYGLSEKDFDIKILSNNLFQEYLETNIFTQRSENFERFISYAEGGDGMIPLFSKKWLMKKFLRFDEKDVLENEEYIKKELEEQKKTGMTLAGGGGGGSGLGDLGGGSSGGGLGDLGDLGGESSGSNDQSNTESADTTGNEQTVDDVLKNEKGKGDSFA